MRTMGLILFSLSLVAAGSAFAIRGKYPITGVPSRDGPVSVSAASPPAASNSCLFGSATFPCAF